MLGVVVALVVIASAWILIARATAEPEQVDFKHFENQRQVLDLSLEVYTPLLANFSTDYGDAFMNKLDDEAKADILASAEQQFDEEARLSQKRLVNMESSLALKDQAVKEEFTDFAEAHNQVADYYKNNLLAMAAVVRALQGPCSVLKDLRVSDPNYAKNYVNTADKCFDSIKTAREDADKKTNKLLDELEKMFKKQQDLSKEFIKKEKQNTNDGTLSEESVAEFRAEFSQLMGLLGINKTVEKLKTEYQVAASEEYNKLAKKMNLASQELKQATEKQLNDYQNGAGA